MSKSHHTDAHKAMVEILATARQEVGIHQDVLAKKLGKHQSFISNIERGQRKVDVIEFVAIARQLGQDPADLFAKVAAALPKSIQI